MSLVMSSAVMAGRTLIGICRVNFKHVFVDVIEVHVMQVTIMQIVGVAGMNDSHMAAGDAVLMVVPLMLGAGTHGILQEGMLSDEAYSRRCVHASAGRVNPSPGASFGRHTGSIPVLSISIRKCHAPGEIVRGGAANQGRPHSK
jgi:hypothetical protein